MTAAIIGLLVIKFYPSKEVKHVKSTRSNPHVTLASPSPTPAVQAFPPRVISIPAVDINLIVSPGKIVNNQWTLYDDKVSWLATSQTPGHGNVILYGHNRPNVLGNLSKVQIGQEIIIETRGQKYVYQIAEKRKVLPNEVDVIVSDKNQLTLYTCDGSFDQRRLVVIAYPKAG